VGRKRKPMGSPARAPPPPACRSRRVASIRQTHDRDPNARDRGEGFSGFPLLLHLAMGWAMDFDGSRKGEGGSRVCGGAEKGGGLVFYRGSTPRWREVDSTSILNSATLPSLPLLAQPMASFWIALSQANFFFFFWPTEKQRGELSLHERKETRPRYDLLPLLLKATVVSLRPTEY
jgi:hypothetical protein